MQNDPWAAFPDAPSAARKDPWADFPDAQPSTAQTPAPAPAPTPSRPQLPSPAQSTTVGGGVGSVPAQQPITFANPVATDGDTIRDGDARVRLLGVDAPELDQRGWRADGSTVPLGQLSRQYLGEQIYDPENMRVASRAGTSWGRIVGSVENSGQDIGLSSLRAGQSVAAPEYIDNPQQRFDYVEAERLARMNRLGVHGTVTLTPSEFRDNPDYEPEREERARFFDMPTPETGMTSDQEQRYLHLLEFGTADEVLEHVQATGYAVDEQHTRAYIANRDAALRRGEDVSGWAGEAVQYKRGVRQLIDPEDGQLGAGVRQYANGFAVGALDELGAIPDTLGLTAGRENIWNSERRWADVYWNNLHQNQAILAHDRARYPGTSTAAEIAGGVTSGFVLPYARGAATAPQLARWGAGYGGAYGFLGTDGGLSERATGAITGATIGAIADPALGKALDYAAPQFGRALQALRGGRGGGGSAPAPSNTASPLDGGPIAPQTVEGISPELMRQAAELGRLRQLEPRAELMASTAHLQPNDLLPMPASIPESNELARFNASRFELAKPVPEQTALRRQTVTNWRGEPVSKVGPLDLVGFMRSQGGLRDQGGELSAMGFNNAARRGLDHVGQETRFGPLVNDEGMNLDDAALAAWEAGYFPESATRPDVNTFLDGLRDTYEGQAGRRFLPEDYGQVEGFQGLRSERFDLEEALQDGPIYQDNSTPAGERPFPPVEAYEDWAGPAVERIGNIDVSKLDTPQDISRALNATHNAMGGFDEATRGRISQAETARLADDLGMTSEQLLGRRQGQAFNAEEALAARQILAKSGNELVNAARNIQSLEVPGDELTSQFREKLVRHVAIQEQIAGMTSEAGRALQQFRQSANSRAVRGDVLSAFVRSGGGSGDLKGAADAILDTVENAPGQFNTVARNATNPNFRDKVGELYINALLSNPPTHIVNMVSNALTTVGQIPEYALAATIGAGRRAAVGKAAGERILASEVGARAVGMLQGTREGMALFAKALRTGEADDFVSKVEGDQYRAISGLKGEVIRLPSRFLTAEDQLFKGIARRMELNAQAVRVANREGLKGDARAERVADLIANPTDDMMARSLDYGLYLTYQRKLGEVGQSVSSAANASLPIKVVIPFVRTPINLLKFSVERSPAAPLLKEWRDDFRAGGDRRDLAVAKMLLGTGIGYSFYTLAQQGLITGARPPDAAKARLMAADGWQPYSLKVGDRYISYSRLDPLSTIIGVAADMATLPDNMSERQREDQATMLTASIMNNLANKTWLSGVASLTAGLSDPQRNAQNWLERTFSAFTVPAGVAGVARQIDPVARQREGIGEAIQARIPGMSDGLFPRRDVFGEPVPMDSLGPDFISPFWQTKTDNDPVVAEMLRIEKSVSAPGKQFTEGEERIDYPRDVYDRYHEIAGRLTYNSLLSLIGSAEYEQMNDAEKRRAAAKAIREARKTARGVLDDPDYPLPPRGEAGNALEDFRASDPFSSFPDAESGGEGAASADPWAEFPDAEQRDVAGSIEQAIPGVRITSGFRTPEYQADMRRRGYTPAQNSAHLYGSALDLVPPAGMSMQELMRRVQAVEPDAYLLPEGDHLHVEFPDYFTAPALGGAASAGIRNPARAQ